jgi:hypothetical protein
MSGTVPAYARFDGDSRSSWERLAWIDPRTWTDPRNGCEVELRTPPQDVCVESSLLTCVELGGTLPITMTPVHARMNNEDQIDVNWKNWDYFDFLSVFGLLLVGMGFIAAFSSSLFSMGILLPIGLGCMTFAAYGARRRDAHAI